MCHNDNFKFNSCFGSDVGSKWHFNAKEESKWLQISVKQHFWGVNLHSNSFKSHFEISDVGSKWHIDAKEELKLLQISVKWHVWGLNLHSNSLKSHFEMTSWIVKMTPLRGLKWLYRCQPKRNQNDSLEGVVLGSRKRLLVGVKMTLLN